MTQQNVVDAANQAKAANDAYANVGEGILPAIQNGNKTLSDLVEACRVHRQAVADALASIGASAPAPSPSPAPSPAPSPSTTVDSFFAAYAGPKILLDPSNSGSRFQDSGGTSALTVAGQSLGRINDIGGGSNHFAMGTAGKRPTFGQEGGRSYVSADAVDDCLVSVNSLDLSGVNKLTMIFGLRKRTISNPAIIAELGGNGEGSGAFAVNATPSGFNVEGTGSSATSQAFIDTANPVLSVLTVQIDLSGASGWVTRIQHNNDAVTDNTLAGSRTFLNANLNLFSRDTYALFGPIDLYSFVLLGGNFPSDANLLMLRQYVAGKTGVTL